MKNILLIQTGGTIAMSAKGDGVELAPQIWSKTLSTRIPELEKLAHIETYPLFFEDSTDLNHTHWIQLATCIYTHYKEYDGFVILHGTDTMAYTASALSYAFKNLQKPVILTGSQVPLSSIRSDARRNLINSIEIATTDLQEVAICFNDHVYRGNRATKMNIGDFNAFESPNFPPLAIIGLEVKSNYQPVPIDNEFIIQPNFSNELIVLTVFPSLNADILMSLDISKLRAIIIRSFGSGNIPTKGSYNLLPFLERCQEEEIILAVVSQAEYDAVDLTKYAAGRTIMEAGAISGGDMTFEASLTKMMWLLDRYSEKEKIKEVFVENLAGERTEKNF